MNLSLALHIIGLVLWFGGLLLLTRFLKLFANESPPMAEHAKFARGCWRGGIIIGLVIMLGTGVYQIAYRGMAYYMSQGWFHTKLTLVVVLFVVTHFVGVQVRRYLAGEGASVKALSMLHGVSGALLVAIVIMTMTMRY